MKTCTRNKFLDCFRPTDIDFDDQTVDCITISKKPSFRRSVSAVFKPSIVQPNLSKKHRDVQRSKSYCQLNTKFNESSSSHTPTTVEEDDDNHGSESPTSTLCFGPTPDSSFRSNDDDDICERSQEQKRVIRRRKTRSNEGLSLRLNHVMYLVVLSLLVTVFWGKYFAVVITTVWIFCVRFSCEGKSLVKLFGSFGFLSKVLSRL